jgi:hypothetical protein
MPSVEAPRFEEGADGLDPVCVWVGGRSFAASDDRPLERCAVPGGIARLDGCAAVEQEPDRVRAAVVGGGVQRGSAVVAPRLEWETEFEHQRDGVVVAGFGRAYECVPIVFVQLGYQAGVVVEQSASLSGVCAQACVQELIDRGGVRIGAVSGKHLGEVASRERGRKPVRSASVGSRCVRVGVVSEEQLDELVRAVGLDRRPNGRGGVAVVVAIAVRVGTGLEQDACGDRVVVADGCGERLLSDRADVGHAVDEQWK